MTEKKTTRFIRWFSQLSIDDVPLVGGKNASLGEMYRELTAGGVNKTSKNSAKKANCPKAVALPPSSQRT
ncbi:MAG TPA: hypothetical protein VLU73_12740 [Methylococcaceae bacterium]|nr:hypothetical protein [Methylococcaceae bacterium]